MKSRGAENSILFNKYTNPTYEVKTTVLVKDDKGALNAASMLGGLGLSNTQQNVENEIGILTSFSLSYRAIQNLNFEIVPGAEKITDPKLQDAVKMAREEANNTEVTQEYIGDSLLKYIFNT